MKDKQLIELLEIFDTFMCESLWMNPAHEPDNIDEIIGSRVTKIYLPNDNISGVVFFGNRYPLSNQDLRPSIHIEFFNKMKEEMPHHWMAGST